MEQKTWMIISSIVSMIGTFLVGFYGARGIPKAGDLIKAPRQKSTKVGWLLIFGGFLLNLVSLLIF
jgi:hypothetical protein